MTDTQTEPDQKTPEEPQEVAGEPQSPADGPEQAAEPQTIDEVVDEEEINKAVVITTTPAGSLTLRPNQKVLDPEQHAALKAIGIDTQTDPGVIPHVRAFVHMCQIRGLDPFAREAYLIGRGKGDNRKYTMQTGIDGYRKMGAATGRLIRVKKVLWTGRDDDDRSFVKTEDEDGDLVMKRIWFDQWPAERGNPGAAKVVIEHLDEDGQITTTGAVANWEMYAPYNDLWEYDQQARKRVQRFDADRKPIKVLGEMWQKGGPHMLAKCAEALAYRMAFPAKMSGIYVTEEMHRLDQQERERKRSEQSRTRREAMEASRRAEAEPEDTVDAEIVEEPAAVAEVTEEVVAEVKADAEQALRLLRAELGWQAEVLGQSVEALGRRWVQQRRKNLPEFTAEELLPLVNGLRSMVIEAARRADMPEAAAYAAVATDGAGPIDVENLGPEDETEQEIDPDAEHPYEGEVEDGPCIHCGLPEGVGPHPEGDQ